MLPAAQNGNQGEDPLALYDYHLPPGRIAQSPAPKRVQAKLMVLPLDGGEPGHVKVAGLPKLLRPGDLLVINQTQVVPARIPAQKATGGKVEIFLLDPVHPRVRRPDGAEEVEALLKSHRPVKPGMRLELGSGEAKVRVKVLERGEKGKVWLKTPLSAILLAQEHGSTPLPPYIKRPQGPGPDDARRYQCVYAAKPGAVAAPTAGLHFSPELLLALKKRGIGTARLTLHVGYGTFAEPSPEDLAQGRLHAEWAELPEKAAFAINQARQNGGRIIAVGTTSLRTLEWVARQKGRIQAHEGWCDLLINEGHRFMAVDGLMTNFHLPRTTLLMLVSALAGRERVLAAYQEAVARDYRFYSFGDAMLLV